MVLSSEKARTDLASIPVADTVSVVSFPAISCPVHKTLCIFRAHIAHINKRITFMEAIILLMFVGFVEDGEGVKKYFSQV